MSVLPILTWPDARLSQSCAPIAPGPDAARLAQDMLDTMYAAPGRGLAGPQVGELRRIFVMDTTWKDGPGTPCIFLNPEITWASASTAQRDEGCLSIPGVLASVSRPAEVDLRWQDPEGGQHVARFEGFAAACVQHEVDHLNGCVTLDRVTPEARLSLLATYEAGA